MKLFIFFILLVLRIESSSSGLTLLYCPSGGSIDCNEVKCCPSDKNTCCIDLSSIKDKISMGCASIYPKGHRLGCCGQKLCSEI